MFHCSLATHFYRDTENGKHDEERAESSGADLMRPNFWFLPTEMQSLSFVMWSETCWKKQSWHGLCLVSSGLAARGAKIELTCPSWSAWLHSWRRKWLCSDRSKISSLQNQPLPSPMGQPALEYEIAKATGTIKELNCAGLKCIWHLKKLCLHQLSLTGLLCISWKIKLESSTLGLQLVLPLGLSVPVAWPHRINLSCFTWKSQTNRLTD